MGISVVLKNHLSKILKEKNMTQKNLANIVGETEATISEFINLKRSVLNINLLLKIATALNIENIEELISFQQAFKINNIKQNKWYTLSNNNNVRFIHINELNEESFRVFELLENGIIIESRYSLENKSKEDIEETFKNLKSKLPKNATEDVSVLKLIEICRYLGEITFTNRSISFEDSLDLFNILS